MHAVPQEPNFTSRGKVRDLRGLSAAAAEAAVLALITECHEEEFLRYEVDFIGRGISADVRLAKVALERAHLAIVRDNLISQFHSFVRMRALV
jgi:hypothetical protein